MEQNKQENEDNVIAPIGDNDLDGTPGTIAPEESKHNEDIKKESRLGSIKNLTYQFKRIDIYFLIFILIVLASGIGMFFVIQKNKPQTNTVSLNPQSLSSQALSQLNTNDVQIGGNSQTLEIQSNTVFSNNALVKGDLQVAGTLKLGGSLNLPGITVSGLTDLDQVSIAGNASIAGNLTVNGSAAFSGTVSAGTISVSNLQLTGDLLIQHHITTTGGIPGISRGSSLGGGGTVSNSGNDTSGTVNIGTGGGAGGGCLANLTYTKSFANIPTVILTPLNGSSANAGYYVSKSTTGFSICATSPGSYQTLSYDYIVID